MGKQVVRQQDGLRSLQVCVAGQHEIPLCLRHLDEGAHHPEEAVAYLFGGVAGEEAQVEGDLIVAAPPRVQLERNVPGQLPQPPLDRRVNVLVRERPREPPASTSLSTASSPRTSAAACSTEMMPCLPPASGRGRWSPGCRRARAGRRRGWRR